MRKRLFTLLTLCLLFVGGMQAQDDKEIYAVLEGTTTTFYYDRYKASSGGVRYWELSWGEVKEKFQTTTKKVVFDESMWYAFPTSTKAWFSDFEIVEEFEGMSNLHTDQCTDMTEMFAHCYKLKEIDLRYFSTQSATSLQSMFMGCKELKTIDIRKFDISNVTNAMLMFAFCDELTTIYCGQDWSRHNFSYSDANIFLSSPKLVGEQGTTYDANHVNSGYARPDGGSSAPGYFTTPKVLYTVYTDADNTLTYYYDELIDTRSGIVETLFYDHRSKYTEYMKKVKKIVLDPSMANAHLTSIDRLFMEKTEWSEFFLPYAETIEGMEYLNTEDVTDMEYMFRGLGSLKELDLSRLNTDKVTIMRGMFMDCASLTSLDLSHLKTDKVTSMRGMFYGCSSLTSLDLSRLNKDNVTDMGYMFYGCESLTSLDLSLFKTDKVEYMDAMFAICTNLTSLDLSSFNTANVEYMDNMFNNCPSLTSINLSSFNTAKVTRMPGMFAGCTSLTSLDLSSFNMDNVEVAYSMFYYCTALQTIYCADEWTLSDSYQMFNECPNLVGGKGTAYDVNHVDGEYARLDGGPAAPGYFTLPKEIYAVLDGTTTTFYYDNRKDERGGVRYWELYWGEVKEKFLTTTTKVVFDPSMDEAHPTSTNAWFSDFEIVEDFVNIHYLHTDQCTDMMEMFAHCYRLKHLDVSHFDTRKVMSMQSMFMGCKELKSIDVNNFNISNLRNVTLMFAFCDKLTTIVCQKDWSMHSFEYSNNMFLDCPNLVGESGTAYDGAYTGSEFARLDGGPAAPGYFSSVDITPIEQVQTTNDQLQTTNKVLRNGMLFIERDGRIYNAQGAEVK